MSSRGTPNELPEAPWPGPLEMLGNGPKRSPCGPLSSSVANGIFKVPWTDPRLRGGNCHDLLWSGASSSPSKEEWKTDSKDSNRIQRKSGRRSKEAVPRIENLDDATGHVVRCVLVVQSPIPGSLFKGLNKYACICGHVLCFLLLKNNT